MIFMDKNNVEAVVYNDSDYPHAWIDASAPAQYPDKIAKYLEKKGLKILNSIELRDFIIKAIEEKRAYGKLVVFSQDVIPDTIAEDYYSNTTLREFLDNGGSILWIGDIPAFYIGKKGMPRDFEASARGAPVYMLGIVPVFGDSVKRSVDITKEGRKIGLKHKWSGIRPILPEPYIKTFAESEVIISRPYIENILSKELADLLKKNIKNKRKIEEVELSKIFKIKFQNEKRDVKQEEVEISTNLQFLHVKFPNSWFKNYNSDFPNSGIYRIWDFGPRNLPNWMLDELYIIIESIKKRLLMDSIITRLFGIPNLYR